MKFWSAERLVALWRAWKSGEGGQAAWRWGNPWLEQQLGDACPGDLVVVGGDTNVGKSHYALGHVCVPMAEANQGRVLYVSLEDPPHRLGRRVDACGYAHERLRVVFLQHNLLSELEQAVREARAHGPLVAVVVDYLQEVAFDGQEQVFNEADTLKRTMTRVRKVCGDAGAVGVLLSQLRRPMTVGEDGRRPFPSIHELHGSSAIERKADAILMLGLGKHKGNVLVELAKAKDSATGERQRLRRGADTHGRLVPAPAAEQQQESGEDSGRFE